MPILRYLTPDVKPVPPDGFTVVDDRILQGLPHFVPLAGELRLAVLVPTGLVRHWLDADPTLVVTHSTRETEPKAVEDEPPGSAEEPAARLVLMDGSVPVASAALTVGRRITLPETGAAGVRVDVVVLGWDLRAGSLRGPGNFGSRITLAWRSADTPIAHFSTPPVNPVLIKRLPPEHRVESRLGLVYEVRLARFHTKRSMVR
jgi:hypothetical protein